MIEWLRAGHILAVIAWMAGMLMLPRILVYRIEGSFDGELARTMDKAALRLRQIILTPAMLLTWGLGIGMAFSLWNDITVVPLWFWMKLVLVLVLSGVHGYFVSLSKKVIAAPESISPKRLRLMNEVPFVIAILVVILVVIEPYF
ncbi:MAG: CopD family protein [Pseudomonadota bacterium]